VEFFQRYAWAINAAPTLGDLVLHLRDEITFYRHSPADWRRDECALNIFILACALSDTADDVMLGRKHDFTKVTNVLSFVAPLTNALQKSLAFADDTRNFNINRRIAAWRASWEDCVNNMLRHVLVKEDRLSALATLDLMAQLASSMPRDLAIRRPRIPAAFRSQDLTHFDVFTLGDKWIAAHPDQCRPVLIIGLRTAGSYFAPLLRAYLVSHGYGQVQCVTARPNRGLAKREQLLIRNAADTQCLGIVIDEPVATGKTFTKGISILRNAGIATERISVLMPVHRNGQNWSSTPEAQALSTVKLFTLEPDEWTKQRVLSSDRLPELIGDYFHSLGWTSVSCTDAEELNRALRATSEDKFHTRAKRVFKVRLARALQGETHYIIAKSVGWGWLSYHAFLAAQSLAGKVPPVLMLRDGFLFSEWLSASSVGNKGRDHMIQDIAQYVATRSTSLQLHDASISDAKLERQLARGTEELASALSMAYGKAGGILKRARIRRDLEGFQNSHQPILIDGRMRRSEWIDTGERFVKTDYEHHGMGKHQLNISDAAYDLAEATLHFHLSEAEEQILIQEYSARSGDCNVADRLLLYKILAGNWSMDRAIENLNDPKMAHRHQEFNRQFIDAWNFLITETVRFCGSRCGKPASIRWASPLAVLDIDGVLDKKIFGFPSATRATIEAISLLHANGIAVALNSARSIAEVKEYSQAYGFCGGVAESGAYICDVINGTEQVLVSAESLAQLEKLRSALKQIPGVFLNDDYKYSVKAHMYERGTTVALPKILVEELIASMELDCLAVCRTFLDTTIVARETDKGKGLRALLALAGLDHAVTYAVGDSAPDLAMFREASFSFAPGHISCGSAARLLGCYVASATYQPGLLECVRQIINQCGGVSDTTPNLTHGCSAQERYFLKLLAIADRHPLWSALRAVLDPMMLDTFLAD
jgi:hydroxymethylpyrimidine pyrophosphatase-like HAD family hydrolase